MHHVCQFVQQRIVAADDHQGVLQLLGGTQQLYFHFRTGFVAFQALGHFQDAVCLHEGGHHAAAAA